MKKSITSLLILVIILLSNISTTSNTTFITKGRCQYVVFKESITHAGDCRYHMDIEDRRHDEIIDKLDDMNKELSKINRK